MNISQTGIELIKEFEGLRLRAYDDGAGVWTIGYGHTKGVTRGQAITLPTAESYLWEDVQSAEDAVNRYVEIRLKQNEFDALVSLVYNIGGVAFLGSTLLRKLNQCDFNGAAEEFDRWIHGGGVVLPGLVRRRAAERRLFESQNRHDSHRDTTPELSIRAVQMVLNNVQGAMLAEDGILGPKTKAALMLFQSDRGLEPTGVIDWPTETLIRQVVD